MPRIVPKSRPVLQSLAMKTYAYLRISVGDEDAESLKYQRRDIAARFGAEYTEIDWHSEAASAVKNDRPVWESLFEKLHTAGEKGEAPVLLAWGVDRLLRNIDDLPRLAKLLDLGVQIRTCKDGDFRAESLFLFGIRSLFAVEEPRRGKERQRARYQEIFEKGGWPWHVPFGYVRKGITVTECPTEGSLAPKVFQHYLECEGGVDAALPGVQRLFAIADKTLNRASLHAMLRNRFYLGEIRYRGQVGIGAHPALVSGPLFRAVQNKLEGGRQYKTQTIHCFPYGSGRSVCSCGRTLTAEAKKGGRFVYMTCTNKKCATKSIPERVFDECASNFFSQYALTGGGVEKIKSAIKAEKADAFANIQKERTVLARSITRAEKLLSGLIDMRAAGEIPAEAFTKKRLEVERQLAQDRARLGTIGQEVPQFLDILEEMFELLETRFQSYNRLKSEEKALVLRVLGSNFFIDGQNQLHMRISEVLAPYFSGDCLVWWSVPDSNR